MPGRGPREAGPRQRQQRQARLVALSRPRRKACRGRELTARKEVRVLRRRVLRRSDLVGGKTHLVVPDDRLPIRRTSNVTATTELRRQLRDSPVAAESPRVETHWAAFAVSAHPFTRTVDETGIGHALPVARPGSRQVPHFHSRVGPDILFNSASVVIGPAGRQRSYPVCHPKLPKRLHHLRLLREQNT